MEQGVTLKQYRDVRRIVTMIPAKKVAARLADNRASLYVVRGCSPVGCFDARWSLADYSKPSLSDSPDDFAPRNCEKRSQASAMGIAPFKVHGYLASVRRCGTNARTKCLLDNHR
jgi:hypothetical protein